MGSAAFAGGVLTGGVLTGGVLTGGVLTGGVLTGGVLVAGEPNWLMKFQTTPEVHVCHPSQVQPSRGPGSWPAPSNAAHTTGYPARQPEYAVTMWVRLPWAGSGGFCGVQPLLRTNVSRNARPFAIGS